MGLKGTFLNMRGFYKADRISSRRKKGSQVQEEMKPGKMIRFRQRE